MLEQESDALTRLGFRRENNAFRMMWTAGKERQTNIITIAKLEKGWSFIWQRGYTYTIHEESVRTFDDVVAVLWKTVFERSENYLELITFQAHHKVNGIAIYGPILRQLARDDFEADAGSDINTATGAAITRAMNQRDDRGKAVKLALDELGSDRAEAIYDDEWGRLVAKSHPRE